jgi:RNA polymerase sigma factor (sigma-70 family)
MNLCAGETTDPLQLIAVGDLGNSEAWEAFVKRYDPLIRRYIYSFQFDRHSREDLIQRIWLELSQRMQSYQPLPHYRFRAWLKRLCQSRAIDQWRKAQRQQLHFLPLTDEHISEQAAQSDVSLDEFEKLLFEQAAIVQETVRLKVDPQSWLVFSRICEHEETVRAVADSLNISYAAAFAAQKRIRKLLRRTARELGFVEPEGSEDGR